MPVQQLVRPFTDTAAPGVTVAGATPEPQLVRLHWGRNGSVKQFNGSLHLTIERYMQDVNTEAVPVNGWPF